MRLNGIPLTVETTVQLSILLEKIIDQAVKENPNATTEDIANAIFQGCEGLMKYATPENIYTYASQEQQS